MDNSEKVVRISGTCSCCKQWTTVFLPRGLLGKRFDQLCGRCYSSIAQERRALAPPPEPPEHSNTHHRTHWRTTTPDRSSDRSRPFLNLYQCRKYPGHQLGSQLTYTHCYLCGGPVSVSRKYS